VSDPVFALPFTMQVSEFVAARRAGIALGQQFEGGHGREGVALEARGEFPHRLRAGVVEHLQGL